MGVQQARELMRVRLGIDWRSRAVSLMKSPVLEEVREEVEGRRRRCCLTMTHREQSLEMAKRKRQQLRHLES